MRVVAGADAGIALRYAITQLIPVGMPPAER